MCPLGATIKLFTALLLVRSLLSGVRRGTWLKAEQSKHLKRHLAKRAAAPARQAPQGGLFIVVCVWGLKDVFFLFFLIEGMKRTLLRVRGVLFPLRLHFL